MAFHDFLGSETAAPEISAVREAHPFGPHAAGFSTGIELEVESISGGELRSLRTVCTGSLHVVGTLQGYPESDPDSPLVVTLVPGPWAAKTLGRICGAAKLETPLAFSYEGVDPWELESRIQQMLGQAPGTPFFAMEALQQWQRFRAGQEGIYVAGGFVFSTLSPATESAGFRSIRFSARTSRSNLLDPTAQPRTFLDPTVLYHHALLASDDSGAPLIPAAETPLAWFASATRDRVLIAFRNEWNEPLVAPGETVTLFGAAGPVATPLGASLSGIVEAPRGSTNLNCELGGRELTAVPSIEGSADWLGINVAAPDQRVVSAVRGEDWFHPTDPSSATGLFQFTAGNDVELLVDGNAAFARLAEDLRKVNAADHFVLIAGWRTMHNFELIAGDVDSTLASLLEAANGNGATIRSLLWYHFGLNLLTHVFVNSLANGESILDNRTHHSVRVDVDFQPPAGLGLGAWLEPTVSHVGSHHWKLVVIRNSDGLCAHIGGIDINDNRLNDPYHTIDSPYHDVQCRLAGPASREALSAFLMRWNDHPDRPNNLTLPPQSPGTAGTAMVQIARTYGAGTQTYSPQGDRTIWASLRRSIQRARKYIYIEDQYLWYGQLGEELLDALARIDHLVIVISRGTVPTGQRARHLVLKPLYAAFPDKVHVYSLRESGTDFTVHTKAVIVDDVFATIGSANMCQRSMTHDSEINAFILDGRIDAGVRKFARDMRIELWAEHLGWHRLPRKRKKDLLGDIDRAVSIIGTAARPETARLVPWDISLGQGESHYPGWFAQVDPDGSADWRQS